MQLTALASVLAAMVISVKAVENYKPRKDIRLVNALQDWLKTVVREGEDGLAVQRHDVWRSGTGLSLIQDSEFRAPLPAKVLHWIFQR